MRMRRSCIYRKGRANNGNTPTAHACLPFIYVDKGGPRQGMFCFCSRRTTIAWNKSQLRGINQNPIVVVCGSFGCSNWRLIIIVIM